MASCYGGSGALIDTVANNKDVLAKCPYLPISKAITYDGSEVQLELTLFTTEAQYLEGFRLMNDVIEEGRSWPFTEVYETMDAYKAYFHSHAAFLVKFKDADTEENNDSAVLGCFYVKPNFPGRCSHICNGGFITNPRFRGLGVGTFMGENFRRLAKDLGYRGSLFNLVFANNEPSVKLWTKLGFTKLSVIPKAASLRGIEGYVDAIQFHCDFYAHEGGDGAEASPS